MKIHVIIEFIFLAIIFLYKPIINILAIVCIFLLLSCSSTPEKIEPPKDYSKVIDKAEKNPGDKKIGDEVLNSLKECQSYSRAAYSEITGLRDEKKKLSDDLTTKTTEFDNLKIKTDLKIKELTEELDTSFWSRPQKKIFLYLTIALVVLGIITIFIKYGDKILALAVRTAKPI